VIDLGPPVLYVAAIVWGTVVAVVAGLVEFALEHGVTRLRGGERAD